jgi:adhesin/invasin
MPRWFTLPPIVALAVLTSCLNGSTTETPATTETGPYSVVATDLKDSTSAPAATILLVRAHVTHDGAAIPLTAVKFTVAAGSGLLSVDSTATDTLGFATVLWTLGDTAKKLNTLAIASGDGVDTLHVIAVAGPASYLLPVSGTPADTPVGTPVTIQVRATDRPGNPVFGTTVFWTNSGGTLSSASSVTDANGVAQITFTSNQAGAFTVSAVLPETASRDFQVTVH